MGGCRVLQSLGNDICGLSHSLSQSSFHRVDQKWRIRKAKARAPEVCVRQGQGGCRCCQGLFPSTL